MERRYLILKILYFLRRKSYDKPTIIVWRGYCLSSAVKKQLEVIEKCIIHGDFKKANKLVAAINKSKDLDDEDKLSSLVLQSEILNKQGKFHEVLKVADDVLNDEIVKNYPLLKLDVTIQKSEALLRINNLKQHKSAYEKGEKQQNILQFLL